MINTQFCIQRNKTIIFNLQFFIHNTQNFSLNHIRFFPNFYNFSLLFNQVCYPAYFFFGNSRTKLPRFFLPAPDPLNFLLFYIGYVHIAILFFCLYDTTLPKGLKQPQSGHTKKHKKKYNNYSACPSQNKNPPLHYSLCKEGYIYYHSMSIAPQVNPPPKPDKIILSPRSNK